MFCLFATELFWRALHTLHSTALRSLSLCILFVQILEICRSQTRGTSSIMEQTRTAKQKRKRKPDCAFVRCHVHCTVCYAIRTPCIIIAGLRKCHALAIALAYAQDNESVEQMIVEWKMAMPDEKFYFRKNIFIKLMQGKDKMKPVVKGSLVGYISSGYIDRSLLDLCIKEDFREGLGLHIPALLAMTKNRHVHFISVSLSAVTICFFQRSATVHAHIHK